MHYFYLINCNSASTNVVNLEPALTKTSVLSVGKGRGVY